MKALREVRKLQKNMELKTAPISGSDSIPIAGAAQVAYMGIAPTAGTGYTNRIGNKITLKSLALRMQLTLGALEADGCTVRFMVVWDRAPRGALAGVTDMIEADNILAAYQTVGASKGRFQFLADRTIDFNAQEGKWTDKFYMKKDLQMQLDGAAGSIADNELGALVVLSMASSNAASITISWRGVARFADD